METDSHVHHYEARIGGRSGGHSHTVKGKTGRARYLPDGRHRHALMGVTEGASHRHYLQTLTGYAVPADHGTHRHAYSGETTPTLNHWHSFRERTSRSRAERHQPKETEEVARTAAGGGFMGRFRDGLAKFFAPREPISGVAGVEDASTAGVTPDAPTDPGR